METYTNKTETLDAIMSFVAANCALPMVQVIDINGELGLVACEIDTRDKVQSVLRTRGLQRACFIVTDRLDTDHTAKFLFSKIRG